MADTPYPNDAWIVERLRERSTTVIADDGDTGTPTGIVEVMDGLCHQAASRIEQLSADLAAANAKVQEVSADAERWIVAADRLPDICSINECSKPVFARLMGGQVLVLARVSDDDGWAWGNTYGNFHFEQGHWVADDIEIDDDYEVVLWCDIPIPPDAARAKPQSET